MSCILEKIYEEKLFLKEKENKSKSQITDYEHLIVNIDLSYSKKLHNLNQQILEIKKEHKETEYK